MKKHKTFKNADKGSFDKFIKNILWSIQEYEKAKRAEKKSIK